MPTELLLLGVLFATLTAYILLGGADFGAGVWDLFAHGERRDAQRDLIEHAMGPVWEANHVWLIFAVVVLFSGFPKAFAALSVAFYVPLTLLLLGIVFRGSAFAIRHALSDQPKPRRRWGLLFSLASVATPLLLGSVVGGAASDRSDWLSPFSLAVGALTLSLCALLAAVYLVNETENPDLQRDFRSRAFAAAGAAILCALAVALLARSHSPRFFARLTQRPESWAMISLTGLLAIGGLWTLRQRPRLSRGLLVSAVLLLLGGWAVAQYPYLLAPDFTVFQSAAASRTQELLLAALGMGSLILGPSLYTLFHVFKREQW